MFFVDLKSQWNYNLFIFLLFYSIETGSVNTNSKPCSNVAAAPMKPSADEEITEKPAPSNSNKLKINGWAVGITTILAIVATIVARTFG